MALEHIEATRLWRSSLAARDGDANAHYRDRLRSALLTMRENVIPFVQNIHRDVLGLTVHEQSHLDALWQTADCIAGDQFDLNPIEAFVFGASILLHDTGLAVAAYPGGLAELRETVVWRDAEAGLRARRIPPHDDAIDQSETQTILFATLRKLHAEQAEKLISFTFRRQNRHEAIPLLQDVGLHDSLGATIGRIAHSHHWNHGDLTAKLVTRAGGVPGFPSEWTLNELKVACLLRCADAAHIDALRAPTMLFAISEVSGISAEHWNFQNKLNSVASDKGKLVFSAGQTFKVDDASSWWLAYDTMVMVDGEIKSCNAILEEAGASQFAVTGVYGIETPKLLSRTVRVEGWTPISAEVKVSDPVHLARTLGGRNLYGAGAMAPIRELLQNAVDAVRARRAHEGRESSWGKIRLIIERPSMATTETWLHVDDTGTGMSERVITGPLIDFGKSFWSSTLMDEEFPGLRSHAPKLVGKFGIGFFSVFLLGDEVKVITRRFNESESSAAVLEFDELARRPLLRKAATGELPLDYTTRVSVKLSETALKQIGPVKVSGFRENHEVNIVSQIVNLVASTDVNIEIIDRSSGDARNHRAEWLEVDGEEFLDEVCSLLSRKQSERIVASCKNRVRPVVELDGTVVGRAALLVSNERASEAVQISVGGFSVKRREIERVSYYIDGRHELPPFKGSGSVVGVLLGNTTDAARARASVVASPEAIAKWAKEQDELIDVEKFTLLQQIDLCHALLRLGAVSEKLPFGFIGGGFATFKEFSEAISAASFVDIPMSHHDYKNKFEFRGIDHLNTPYYTSNLHSTVSVVSRVTSGNDILTEDERKEIVEGGSYSLDISQARDILDDFALKRLAQLAETIWGGVPEFEIKRVNLVDESSDVGRLMCWSLRISRPE